MPIRPENRHHYGAAWKALGVPAIGIELEPAYCEIAERRLREEGQR